METPKRKQIFDEFLSSMNDLSRTNISFHEFCSTYFFHPSSDAIRLNFYGSNILSMSLKCYKVDVVGQKKSEIPFKHYHYLAKFCRKPYYIGENYIMFFDEEEAFLFKLCDGSIDNVKEVSPNSLS